MLGLYPKTVPLESHSLTAEQFAAIAFSEWVHTFDPKHFDTLIFDLEEIHDSNKFKTYLSSPDGFTEYCLMASFLRRLGAFVF